MAFYLPNNWTSPEWQFYWPQAGLAENGYIGLGQETNGALSEDFVWEYGITGEPTFNFVNADNYAQTTGSDFDWKTAVNAKLSANESAMYGLYYTVKMNDAFSLKTKPSGTKTTQTITASHSLTYTPQGAASVNSIDSYFVSGLKSVNVNADVDFIWRGPDNDSWSLSQEAYIDSDDNFKQSFKQSSTDTATGDVTISGNFYVGGIDGYQNVTVAPTNFFALEVVEGGNETKNTNATYQSTMVTKGNTSATFSEKITRTIKKDEISQGKVIVGTEKAGAAGSIGCGLTDISGYSTSDLGIHNVATVSLFGKSVKEEIHVGDEAPVSIDGGNTKENKNISWERGEDQKYDSSTGTYTFTDKIKSSSKNTLDRSSTGAFTSQFADIEGDVLGFQTVKLSIATDAEKFWIENTSQSESSDLSATAVYSVNPDTARESVSVTFNSKYDDSYSSKPAGSFVATGVISEANDYKLITADNIWGYASVTLKNVEIGQEEAWYPTYIAADRQEKETVSRKIEFSTVDNYLYGENYQSDILKYKSSEKETADYTTTGVFTLQNDKIAENYGVAGDIYYFKSVKISNARITGQISAINEKHSRSTDISFVGETSTKSKSITETYTESQSYSNASDVTLDNVVVGGEIYGYDKVKLDNVSCGAVSRNEAEAHNSKTTYTTDSNGLLTVSTTYNSTLKSGGTFTASNLDCGSINYYATVQLTNSSASGISNLIDQTFSQKDSFTYETFSVYFAREWAPEYLNDDYEYYANDEWSYEHPAFEYFDELDNVDAFNHADFLTNCDVEFGNYTKSSTSLSLTAKVNGAITMNGSYCESISGYKSVELNSSCVGGDIFLGYEPLEEKLGLVGDEALLRGDFVGSFTELHEDQKDETTLKKSWTSTGTLKLTDSEVDGNVFYLQKVTAKGDCYLANYYGSYGADTFALEKGSQFSCDSIVFDKGNDIFSIGDNTQAYIGWLSFGTGTDKLTIGNNCSVNLGDFDYNSLNSVAIGNNSKLYVSEGAYDAMKDMRQYKNYCSSGAIAIG